MNIALIIIAGFITTIIVATIITSINYRDLKQVRQSLENMVDTAEKQFTDGMELVSKNELVLTNSGKELLRLLTEIQEDKADAKNQVLYSKRKNIGNPNFALVSTTVAAIILFVAINNIPILNLQKTWILALPSLLVFSNWILQLFVRKTRRNLWRPSFAIR